VLRGKLDALLGLAEASDCRRVRLLAYFGQDSAPCGNCDNCLEPPAMWDASKPAQMLLSTIYRVDRQSGMRFGAGHLMDILRGKATEKITQHGHRSLSTFGLGAEFSETQLRGVLRQLLAMGAVRVDAEAFNTLALTEGSRAVLRGEAAVRLRQSVAKAPSRSNTSATHKTRGRPRLWCPLP